VVKAPVADVTNAWRRLRDYPKFITAIKRVRNWTEPFFPRLAGINGKQYETTLEMMCVFRSGDSPGELWPTAALLIICAGVFLSCPRPDQSTSITLKLTSSFGGAVSIGSDSISTILRD